MCLPSYAYFLFCYYQDKRTLLVYINLDNGFTILTNVSAGHGRAACCQVRVSGCISEH